MFLYFVENLNTRFNRASVNNFNIMIVFQGLRNVKTNAAFLAALHLYVHCTRSHLTGPHCTLSQRDPCGKVSFPSAFEHTHTHTHGAVTKVRAETKPYLGIKQHTWQTISINQDFNGTVWSVPLTLPLLNHNFHAVA